MATKFKADSRRWLTMGYRPLELEQEIGDFWDNKKVSRVLSKAKEANNIGVLGYVEGPPTLNGTQHIGHARGRVMKDFRYRFKTMQGFYVTFRAGWDTQGLPIELEVERELGVKSKRELLERVGEERFVEECKKIVMKYYDEWRKADQKLGLFIDYDKAYWTHHDRYIEREWQYLKRAWDGGLLGQGYYVVAYCPHCQTSLSNAEVGLGYEEVEDTSLYFKLKVSNSENEYLIVWTTMPFTLVTDMMLGVSSEEKYARVKVDTETWILARQRVEPVMEELGVRNYSIHEIMQGKKLKGVRYEYPFKDVVPKQRDFDSQPLIHSVICEDFVDVTTATGIVHLSPANGEDDFLAAQKRRLPMYAPYDDECRFTDEAGEFAGLFARDADVKVVDELRERGLLLSAKPIRHEYPTCWRSHHKLIWLARREYFLWTDKINDKVMEAARKVRYFYESPKNRFLSFLQEGKPWCISRERVWGAPLPIWVCEKCGAKVLVSKREDLLKNSLESPKGTFELHKPWIDLVVLRCNKCGGKMRREPFVLDCWHDSGASPYASFTDNEFRRFVPVDFLTEAMDQTRGWGNSLLLEHVILTGSPTSPYESFLFYGFVLDAKGRKMSKSLGNVIEVNPLLQKYSADVSRFYILWKGSPVESMNFNTNELKGRPYQVLSTLYHLHRFFMQNAEYDHFNPRKHTLAWAIKSKNLKKPDRWILSRLQQIVKVVTEKAEACQFHLALSNLEDFVVNVLSRQYVPLVRRNLWSDNPEFLNRRLSIYATLWSTLKTIVLLLNPATPFLCEAMYQRVYRMLDNNLKESVNFETWPKPDKSLQDPRLEKEFDTLLRCISLVYSARQSSRLKRRWPLKEIIVIAPNDIRKSLMNLEDSLLELANVKKVRYRKKLPDVDSERWVLAPNSELQILLDTYRDEALEGEGLMRDLARRVQALRKELGFMPTDILNAVYIAKLDPDSINLLEPLKNELAGLVRTRMLFFYERKIDVKSEWFERELDHNRIYVAIN